MVIGSKAVSAACIGVRERDNSVLQLVLRDLFAQPEQMEKPGVTPANSTAHADAFGLQHSEWASSCQAQC